MRPPTLPIGLLAALALAALPVGARAQDAGGAPPAARPAHATACPDRFAPDDEPIEVVRGCEKAAAAAGARERPARLVALAKLYAALESTLCGPCGAAPDVSAGCDAFLAFAEANPGAFRPRDGGGLEYTGRELAPVAEAARASPEAEEARRLASSLARAALPAGCAYPDAGTECTVPLGPDPVRTVRRCLASLGADEGDAARLRGAGFLCTGLVHACREPGARCVGAERLFDDFPEVFPEADARDPARGAKPSRQYRGRFEAEVMRRWPDAPGAGDALWAAALTAADVAPGPCPVSAPDVKQDELVEIALGCDRSAYAAEGPSQAAYLLAAGRLFDALVARGTWGVGSRYDRLLRARESLDFVKDPAGGWRYTRRHFRWILERFPSTPEADEADWVLASAPGRDPCTGSFAACQLAPVLPLATYASRRPSGSHVDEAIARTNERLTAIVERVRAGGAAADAAVDRPVLEKWEALVAKLPAERRRATDDLLQAWRTWIDGAARARAKRP